MEKTPALTGGSQIDHEALMALVVHGDMSKLTPEQKLQYYRARCDAAGLDYRTQPFEFIKLQGKEVLYAKKGATEQLASNHGVVVEIVSQNTDHDVRTVVVRARAKDGRQTDEIGCVGIKGFMGDALGNAYMKAVTKAKRRAILSICGIGLMDETEVETVAPKPAGAPSAQAPAAVGAADPEPGVMLTVAKITKAPDGTFKAYTPANVGYLLKDEAMAKALRALTGRTVWCKVTGEDPALIVEFKDPTAGVA